MRKVYTLLLIIVLSVPAFAIDKNMYNSGNIQPASPEFIKSLKAVSANDLGIFNPQTKQSETMVVEDSDTLRYKYFLIFCRAKIRFNTGTNREL